MINTQWPRYIGELTSLLSFCTPSVNSAKLDAAWIWSKLEHIKKSIMHHTILIGGGIGRSTWAKAVKSAGGVVSFTHISYGTDPASAMRSLSRCCSWIGIVSLYENIIQDMVADRCPIAIWRKYIMFSQVLEPKNYHIFYTFLFYDHSFQSRCIPYYHHRTSSKQESPTANLHRVLRPPGRGACQLPALAKHALFLHQSIWVWARMIAAQVCACQGQKEAFDAGS